MTPEEHLPLPAVLDEDIVWVCAALGLPATAFSGQDGSDPRLSVMKSMASLDVEACPGSGKTTLLVAKLAVLARHWTSRRGGICVLSHTNVARREIETQLGNTSEGKRLLSYPHFVGTIHGFVNEFLAVPWMRSQRLHARIVDDDLCLRRRLSKLSGKTRYALNSGGLDHNVLRLAGTDYSLHPIRWGKGQLSEKTETYGALQSACRESCQEGFFCHDEMFLWARELLDRVPQIAGSLRGRFPLLFLDEVQDTSEEQGTLLFRIFKKGGSSVIRQRFGDSNQAIFQYGGQSGVVDTDPFPEVNLRMPIPNSYRFGQQIADFANPLAVIPHGLVGLGPRHDVISTNTEGKHVIFLFDDLTVGEVLPCYASYLMELFSPLELKSGIFSAVGAIQRSDSDDKVPRYIPHYWPAYDPSLSAVEPRPQTFLQYVALGRRRAQASGDAHHIVERIADGILRLANILNPLADLSGRRRKHRYIRELLSGQPNADQAYLEIVTALMARDIDVPSEEWAQKWASRIKQLADVIAGTTAGPSDAAAAFLAFKVVGAGHQQLDASQRDNVYRFPPQNPKVQLRVGSIHSVKGETHTATLVVDTFYRKHNLATLKPWLTGTNLGKGSEKTENISRLKLHYVGMTRPSHLLCLAMREDSLLGGDVKKLAARKWRVGRVTKIGTVWL